MSLVSLILMLMHTCFRTAVEGGNYYYYYCLGIFGDWSPAVTSAGKHVYPLGVRLSSFWYIICCSCLFDSACMSASLSVCLSVRVCFVCLCLSGCFSFSLHSYIHPLAKGVFLSVCLSICLTGASYSLSVCLFNPFCPSLCLSPTSMYPSIVHTLVLYIPYVSIMRALNFCWRWHLFTHAVCFIHVFPVMVYLFFVVAEYKALCPMGPGFGPDGMGRQDFSNNVSDSDSCWACCAEIHVYV